MGSLEFWSMVAILCQTLLAVVMSWMTLDCKFEPNSSELHEATLMKILYLYDPEACGRIHLYNLTASIKYERIFTSVMWPITNHVAARFRTSIQLWLSLHLIWLLFSIINVTQGKRSCSFYATLLPFTITGIALLITDMINAIIFLIDARYTFSEAAILRYLATQGQVRAISKKPLMPEMGNAGEDTSWIAVFLAYSSMRGIVQWVINFWIVKDNYLEGLQRYRQKRVPKRRTRGKSSSSLN